MPALPLLSLQPYTFCLFDILIHIQWLASAWRKAGFQAVLAVL